MKIIDIYWQRANLHLRLDKKIDKEEVLLVNKNNKIKIEDNKNEIVFNITNTPEGKCLLQGEYKIKVDNRYVLIDDKLFNKLLDKSRNFYYERKTEVCLIDFNTNESHEFIMNVDYFKKNYKRITLGI